MKMFCLVLGVGAGLWLAGCAAGPAGSGSGENAVVHQVTQGDLEATKSKTPLSADSAVLFVNGLGCPLCASNVDKQLLRLRGVQTATVDLSAGTVTIELGGNRRPSPAALASAVEDAGFTLVKIEAR